MKIPILLPGACWNAENAPQLMADVPSERVTPARAFSTCGIDFAGPLNAQCQRQEKSQDLYRCLHSELVSSLTKEVYIMALKRFKSRRGAPKKIITDHGSIFISARNEFLRLQALPNKETVEGKQLETLDRSRF